MNWKGYGFSKSCNKIDITGQTPGMIVAVRIRGIGTNGPGA